jgi:hypothetical protein
VTAPSTSTSVVNGSAPVPPASNIVGMMAIDSYHDAFAVS